jgi:ketosteroid isomerase-like protein
VTEGGCAAYVRFFETLRPETLAGLDQLVAHDIRFQDPFNAVQGPAAVRRVFEKMFEDVGDPRFQVIRHVEADGVCFLQWQFSGRLQSLGGKPFSFVGISVVRFDATGRVVEHTDFWDAAEHFYEKVPLLGWVLRKIKKRCRVG